MKYLLVLLQKEMTEQRITEQATQCRTKLNNRLERIKQNQKSKIKKKGKAAHMRAEHRIAEHRAEQNKSKHSRTKQCITI